MKEPSKDFFRRELKWDVDSVRSEKIGGRASGSAVYRTSLQAADSEQVPARVVSKHVNVSDCLSHCVNPGDVYEPLREYYAYDLLAGIGVSTSKVYYKEMAPRGESYVIVMEDLSLDGQIFDPHHAWNDLEMNAILNCYSQLHGAGYRLFRDSSQREKLVWLQEEECSRANSGILQKMMARFDTSDVLEKHGAPLQSKYSSMIDRYDSLLQLLKSEKRTLVYTDFYPGNVAIPNDLSKDSSAILFDWHLLGYGLPQEDLLNILSGGVPYPKREGYVRSYINKMRSLHGEDIEESRCLCVLDAVWVTAMVYVLWLLYRRIDMFDSGADRIPEWMRSVYGKLLSGEILLRFEKALDDPRWGESL